MRHPLLFPVCAVLALGACASGVNAARDGEGEGDRPLAAMTAIECSVTGKAAPAAQHNGACEAFLAAFAEAGLSPKVAGIVLDASSDAAAEAVVTLAAGGAPVRLQFDSMDRPMDRAGWTRFAADAARHCKGLVH